MENQKKSKKILIISIILVIILILIILGIFLAKKNGIKGIKVTLVRENTTLAQTEEIPENLLAEDQIEETQEETEEEIQEEPIEEPEPSESPAPSPSETPSPTPSQTFVPVTFKSLSYGTSENGRNLVYYSITPQNYTSTIFMNFAIHGYEDSYAKDAQLLVNLAEGLKDYYSGVSSEQLYNTRILIVPCANPDGLYDGTTNNGFGRCNAKGIDLNRDFDALHKVYDTARNYTQYPFSAKESTALKNLIQSENPTVVLDFHGWENCTIGDGSVANAFKNTVGLRHKTEFNTNCNGYFSYWAHLQGAKSLLVEFKNPSSINKNNVISAINILLQNF